MSAGDEIELRMIMADYNITDGCVYEQHEHLYKLTSAASRSFDRFSADFDIYIFVDARGNGLE